MTQNDLLSQGIKPEWLAVIRRLQSVSKNGGLTIVSISIVVDQDGIPRFWLEPRCRKIEPRKSAEETLAMLVAASRDGVVS